MAKTEAAEMFTIDRDECIQMFKDLGKEKADKWTDERLGDAIDGLCKKDKKETLSKLKGKKASLKLATGLFKAVEDEQEIGLESGEEDEDEVDTETEDGDEEAEDDEEDDEEEEKPSKKGKKDKKPAKKSKKDEDEEEDEEDEESEDEDDEDEEEEEEEEDEDDEEDSKSKKKGKDKKVEKKKKKGGVGAGGSREQFKKVGICEFIRNALMETSKEDPITKAELVKKLVKKFPEREEEALKRTVNGQIHYNLKVNQDVEPKNNGEGGFYITKEDKKKLASTRKTKSSESKNEEKETKKAPKKEDKKSDKKKKKAKAK